MDMNEQTIARLLSETSEVKGQLNGLIGIIQNNHESSNRRLDDFRQSMESRMGGVEDRLGKLEENERGTAIRSSATGALAGAIVAGAIAALKSGVGH